jgi:hypothetical protein
MYSVGVFQILGLLNLVGLLLLGYLLFREKQFLRQLFPKDQKDYQESKKEASLLIRDKFKELLSEIEEVKRREEILQRNFRDLSKEGLGHIQRIEILRYNPFDDTGGDQSFSIVMLDGKFDGLVLTSMHSRSGTRVYAKLVKEGKSEMELSKEEKQVLKKALDSD